MTDIRTVLATNLKKCRLDRGWSQAILAEKIGTSPHYIGMMETANKYPSSEMVQKLASALGIDPTELFLKEIDPEIKMKNSRKAAFEDVGKAVSHFLSCYIAEKVRDLDTKTKEEGK